jgi:hypothetical protein
MIIKTLARARQHHRQGGSYKLGKTAIGLIAEADVKVSQQIFIACLGRKRLVGLRDQLIVGLVKNEPTSVEYEENRGVNAPRYQCRHAIEVRHLSASAFSSVRSL